MSTLRFFTTHPIKAKKIKLAVGTRCELCSREQMLDDLEIHTTIDEDWAQQHPPADLEGSLLVLCTWCHCDLHVFAVPTSDQEALIRDRLEMVRQVIREILSYTPKPYTPPDTDMEQFFLDVKQPTQLMFGV